MSIELSKSLLFAMIFRKKGALMNRTHYRSCNLCEATCGLEITYDGKEIISIKGDKKDPLSKGHICPKAVALKDIYSDPDRLKKPIIRNGSSWQEISWDKAIDEAVKKIREIQKKYGKDAIATYLGNPVAHNFGTMLYLPYLLKALGTKQKYSATSIDQLPHNFAAYFMFGHYLLLPVPDIDRTDFMMIIGGNPAVSNGSIMTAPDIINRLKNLKQRGGKLVVIDPRRTETAKLATKHIFIRPGTDAAFLLAMLNVIFSEGLEKPGRLAEFTDGLDKIREISANFPPEKIERFTGIDPDTTREIAREFAKAKKGVVYGRFGASTQEFGGLTQWLINVLNIVTGNLDREGGAMFTSPAVDLVAMSQMTGSKGGFSRRFSRVRKLPEFAGEFPVATLADEILTSGEGQIKGLITIGGNPVLSVPNGKKLEKALESIEFMLSIDIYINETTRFADIILPPTTGLESPVFEILFYHLSVKNFVKYSPPLFQKKDLQKYDWEIISQLASKLSGQEPVSQSPEQMLNFMLQFSSYNLTLTDLMQNPYGIDLGPLKSVLPDRLATDDKKIHIAHELFLKDVKRLEKKLKASDINDRFPFLLIGRRDIRSNNSWMHNSERLVKGRNRCTVLINKNDAENLGIKNEDIVKIVSSTGSIEIEAETTGDIMPGVVSIPHGWGHNREGIKLRVAENHPGVSVNDITNDEFIDRLTGNAAFSGVRVRVEKE